MSMKRSPIEPADSPPVRTMLIARAVFIKWEKLRIVYNILLLVLLWFVVTPMTHRSVLNPFLLTYYLLGGLAANMCFFAGPLLESYLAWLKIQSPWITAAIFIGGVLVSVPLLVAYISMVPRPMAD